MDVRLAMTRFRHCSMPPMPGSARSGTVALREGFAWCSARRCGLEDVVRVRSFAGMRPPSLILEICRAISRHPNWGVAGVVIVRYGKAQPGSAPKRRSVLLVPEMDWVVEVLDQWVHEIRPRFGPPKRHPALCR